MYAVKMDLYLNTKAQAKDVWQAPQHVTKEQGSLNFPFTLSLCLGSVCLPKSRNSSLRGMAHGTPCP